jgi:diguanylate cyclase (GGDEF)-like protein
MRTQRILRGRAARRCGKRRAGPIVADEVAFSRSITSRVVKATLPDPNIMAAMDGSLVSNEIVSLLEVRESALVPAWTAQHFAALLGASQAHVLHVYPVAAARRKEAGGSLYAVAADSDPSPQPVVPDSDLSRAIDGRRVASGQGALFIPLVALDEVRHVVQVVGGRPALPVLECLMPVIARYFERLVDAESDALTRLSNRRVFYTQVSAGLQRWPRGPQPYFLAVLDIDHFKQVNDRYGHLYGDEILIHFARLMRRTFRAGDLLFRFGGEEFVAVYGVDREESGEAPLERFRRATADYRFPKVEGVTASIGFTPVGDGSLPPTTLIDRADQALYYAKTHGRNRVCAYEALVAAGEVAAPASSQSEATLF